MARVTAVFEDHSRAEGAVTELRRLGVIETKRKLSRQAPRLTPQVNEPPRARLLGPAPAYSSGWQLSRSQGLGRLSPQGLSLPLSGRPVAPWPRAQSWVAPRVLSLAG